MQRWLALALLSGCTLYFGGPEDVGEPGSAPEPEAIRPDAAVPRPQGTCAFDVSLSLVDNMFTSIPLTLDHAGTTLCVRLDTTARTHPTYFDVQTPMEPAQPSSFGLTLHEPDGQLIASGYDAPLTTGQTYATVAYEVTTNGILYVKVHAWARTGAQATQLKLGLFQILD